MNLDPKKTALLMMDFQQGIFGMVAGSEACIGNAAKVASVARKKNYKIIHIGLGFEEGHPEIPDNQRNFKNIKQNNLFVKGSKSAEFHPSLFQEKDLIIYKQRVAAFSENQLHMVLRAQGIENLILCGIATSGIVLSTLRRAFDLDYFCTVIKDACYDRDPEVHGILTEKVFTNQADVTTADEFLAAN